MFGVWKPKVTVATKTYITLKELLFPEKKTTMAKT